MYMYELFMPAVLITMLMAGSDSDSSSFSDRVLQTVHSFTPVTPVLYACKPCTCEENNHSITANCTDRSLPYIPQISNAINISVLLMDSNQLRVLETGCFSKYANLNELNLASNKISTIHVGAFHNLHKLQVLNLENNNLKYVDSVFKLSVFRPLRSLKALLLNKNIVQGEHNTRYPDAALSTLVSLKELGLDGLTNQSFGEGFSNLTHLTHLSLAGQNGYCKLIGLFNTTFTHVSHLELLNLSHCDIRHIEPAAFVPLRSTLDVLDLSYNQKIKFNNIFNGSFGWEHSKLRVLNISHIFTNLTSVQIPDLSAKHLQKIPEHLFKGLSSLQVLKLSYNNLIYVPMHIKHMTNLEKIDFASNKIRWLPRTLMSELDSLIETRNCSITIDLSHNPISCECPNLTFLKWMRHTKVKQVEMAYYYCLNADGHTVNLTDLPAIVDSLEAACTTHKYIALVAFLLNAVFWLVFFALCLYRHRWKARYWYYGIRHRFRRNQSSSDARQNQFLHDAFIVYAGEDHEFIMEMLEMVETRGGKNLKIHERDFVPGLPIIVNILESVKSSRKTVLVLSRHFLKSHWCQFEMQVAVQESAYTGRDVLLVLKLEVIPHGKLPKNILQQMIKDLYLEYQHEEHNQLFWQRFINEIEET